MGMPYEFKLDQEAHALRAFRIDEARNRFVYFEGATWPSDERAGVELWLRRTDLLYVLQPDGSTAIGLDVLDREGSILHTFGLSDAGFEYLRCRLKFRREEEVRS